jgi:pSer/pThr/pTyr-binding forkhead associated (FHA) protein
MPVRLLVKSRAVTGDKPPEEFVLSDEVIAIGRDKVCQVVLNDQVVSRTHVRITRDGALYFLEDPGSSFGTRVNAAPLPKGEKRLLRNGDVIAVGPFDVTFDRVADVAAEQDEKTSFLAKKVVKDALRGLSSGQAPYLRVMNGPLEGKRFEIHEAHELVIGREDGVDIILDDDLTSRRHANLRRDWEGTHIEDLQSRNGVKVNKRPISGPQTLKDRDEVEVGGTRFIFLDPAQVRETPVVPEAKPRPLADAEEEGTDVQKEDPQHEAGAPREGPGEAAEEGDGPEDEPPEEDEESGEPAPGDQEEAGMSPAEASTGDADVPQEGPRPPGRAPAGVAAALRERLSKLPGLPAGVDAQALVPALVAGGIAVLALVILGLLFFAV